MHFPFCLAHFPFKRKTKKEMKNEKRKTKKEKSNEKCSMLNVK